MVHVVTAAAAVPPPSDGTALLASPAALPERHTRGWIELLLGGQITNTHGAVLPHAVLTVRGRQVSADAHGTFEILTTSPARRPAPIDVRVTAPGHHPLTTQLLVLADDPDAAALQQPRPEQDAVRPTQLNDGTLVVLHNFMLTEQTTATSG